MNIWHLKHDWAFEDFVFSVSSSAVYEASYNFWTKSVICALIYNVFVTLDATIGDWNASSYFIMALVYKTVIDWFASVSKCADDEIFLV